MRVDTSRSLPHDPLEVTAPLEDTARMTLRPLVQPTTPQSPEPLSPELQSPAPQTLTIRDASAADAEILAAFAERTFREAFDADNRPEDMEDYVRRAFSVETIRDELEDETSTFLLAFAADPDDLIGYAKLRHGDAHESVDGPDPIELQRIYVDPAVIGQGLGAALLQASFDAARDAGYRTLWLGVWENNVRAIAFYEKWRFETVGDQTFHLGSDDQRDVVMQRAV